MRIGVGPCLPPNGGKLQCALQLSQQQWPPLSSVYYVRLFHYFIRIQMLLTGDKSNALMH